MPLAVLFDTPVSQYVRGPMRPGMDSVVTWIQEGSWGGLVAIFLRVSFATFWNLEDIV